MAVEELEPVTVDLADPAYYADPYPGLAAARRAGPIARLANGQRLFLRYDDVSKAMRDSGFHAPKMETLTAIGITSGPFYDDYWSLNVSQFEGAEHGAIRRLLLKPFTPRFVAELRPLMRSTAVGLIDRWQGGSVDFETEFAAHYPTLIILQMLGLPPEDHLQIEAWDEEIALGFTAVLPDGQLGKTDAAVAALRDYIKGHIAERRIRPREDLLTTLMTIEEDGRRLSERELVANVINLFHAAMDTTRAMFSFGLLTLLRHPDQLARLRSDRSRMSAAVEEILRYEPPIGTTVRCCVQDTMLGGVEVPKGETVALSLLSANRDPDIFGNPDRFDIDRYEPGHVGKHATFGHGPHVCLGAALARAEGQEAFDVILDACAGIELVREPNWIPFTAVRRIDSLPIEIARA